jgi:hypothetical protein
VTVIQAEALYRLECKLHINGTFILPKLVFIRFQVNIDIPIKAPERDVLTMTNINKKEMTREPQLLQLLYAT